MNTARFTLSALVIGILCLVLVQTSHAQTLTLTQPFTHEGLTFSAPLSFDTSSPQLLTPVTLEFGTVDEIDVQPTTQQNVAVETLVTPTPTPDQDTIHPDYTTGNVTPTLNPTATPTPLPQTIASSQKADSASGLDRPLDKTATPTPTPQVAIITSPSNPGGLNADILFQMVNDYRASKGLPAFQKDDKTCSLAASRAPEVGEEIANGHMHSGLRNRNLPYWNTENIISMRNETEAFNWWINDEIHKEAIESHNTYSCVACSGNSCAEEFTSYQPK